MLTYSYTTDFVCEPVCAMPPAPAPAKPALQGLLGEASMGFKVAIGLILLGGLATGVYVMSHQEQTWSY